MKFFKVAVLLVAGCLLSGFASAQSHNTLSAREKAEGWQLLFNGNNLDGWRSYLEKAPGKDWSVSQGAIELTRGKDGSEKDFQDIITDTQFENFDLKLEWKTSPCADGGVMFDVHESPQYHETYETGPEMQIADLACTKPDSRVLYERAGDLFDLISSDVERVNETGAWNQYEIRLEHGHLQLFQNGFKVVDTQLWSPQWNQLVASTKFAKMPGFAHFHQGHISLQGTENKGQTPVHIWFRDIRIRRL